MAFFVIIPVKGNKYYKPVNRNYFSRPLKIHPIIIRRIPWPMQMKFCVIPYNSYGVKIACFWPLFSCKDTPRMPQPFSLLLHRPECENGCQHWCILWIEFDFDFWNQIFKISDFNAILNLCNHPDPKAPRLVVRQGPPVGGQNIRQILDDVQNFDVHFQSPLRKRKALWFSHKRVEMACLNLAESTEPWSSDRSKAKSQSAQIHLHQFHTTRIRASQRGQTQA